MAGACARTDGVRRVWRALAVSVVSIRGVQSLNYVLTNSENGVSNPQGDELDPCLPGVRTSRLEAVMDRDVVDGLAEHKTDQCNDVQVCQSLR